MKSNKKMARPEDPHKPKPCGKCPCGNPQLTQLQRDGSSVRFCSVCGAFKREVAGEDTK